MRRQHCSYWSRRYFHLPLGRSMAHTLYYVNKEYNLGILKGIPLFLNVLKSFWFPV